MKKDSGIVAALLVGALVGMIIGYMGASINFTNDLKTLVKQGIVQQIKE